MAVAVALCVIGCAQPKAEYVTVDGQMLGTFLHLVAETDVEPSEIYARMMQLDSAAKRSMSIFDENSLLSRINSGKTDSLDSHIIYNIELAQRVSRTSGGVYDVTVKPLTSAYGFAREKREYVVNVDSLMEFVGMDKISIVDGRLVKADERVQLDFNSIAKGYTVDLAAEALEQMGIENYIVDIGGEVRCRGVNKKGVAWRVGIETPFEGNNTNGEHIQQVISLSNRSMATSGNYRRYYVDDLGRKVVHTIDARTGQSVVSDLLSATVIAPTCAEADAYGTMFMALGKERAIALARELSSSGVMVYFITAGEGDEYEVYYSADLQSVISQSAGFNII
ncbi:MAG: FAD:protein FMN transferase [Alistipes sp.]|nr:FAD:protein FMN transferase [Alistipes sp.]